MAISEVVIGRKLHRDSVITRIFGRDEVIGTPLGGAPNKDGVAHESWELIRFLNQGVQKNEPPFPPSVDTTGEPNIICSTTQDLDVK